MSEQDYRQMMLQQAMRSGNYGASQAQSWDARLKVVSGTVLVKPSEAEEWSRITGEMPLDPNDTVKTSADGVAEIYLDDKGALYLGRNTELEITDMELEDTILSLNAGSLAAKIKHSLNEKAKLQVRTPSAVCAVRGTEFAVEYSQMGRRSSVGVFDEGRVAVTEAGGKDEYLLEKNTEIHFDTAHKRFRAIPLSQMGRHRGSIVALRTRLASLKGWRPRSITRRADLRNQALRKVVRKQLKEKVKPGKRGAKARAAARRAKARKAAAEEAD